MPACTSAASKPDKNLSSDQVAPDSSIPMCRRWKDSQQPNRVSTFLHAIREQPASNADSGPNICDQWIQSDATAEAPLLRPQRRRGNITMVCGCSARLCSLSWAAEKCLCLADTQHRQPASLGASLSIWLKSRQHNAGNPMTLHICVFIISISLRQHVSKYFKLSPNNVAALYSEWHRLQVNV